MKDLLHCYPPGESGKKERERKRKGEGGREGKRERERELLTLLSHP